MDADIRQGIKDSWPVALGYFPLGVAFGLLVVQMGFAWWWAPIFSVVIYAGSMEFLALGLITSGTGWFASLVTGFLVNFRHIFYGLTYPRHRIKSVAGRAYATYALTDEVYAITGKFGSDGLEDGKPVASRRLLTISVFSHLAWVGSGVVGALAGSAVVIPWEGLDFALTAMFTVLALDAFRANPDFSLPLIAVVLALIAGTFFLDSMLIVALLAFFAVLVTRFYSPALDKVLTWKNTKAKEV